jgi:S-adenosylmethionine hydrolase
VTTFLPSGIVTLTTDFGTADGWVGAMKGVCLRVERALVLVDVAHDVPPQDVACGAATLAVAAPEMPPGTTHLAVVDPGVGTARALLVVVAGGHAFVAPDNGLLDEVVPRLGAAAAWRIEAHAWLPAARSATFHGRDVLAPTAAALAAGRLRPEAVGPSVAWAPRPRDGDTIVVRYADRFGNLVTSLREPPPGGLVLPDGTRARLVRTYAEAKPGEVVALMGSDGYVELALRDGSAAASTGLTRGARLGDAP